jgi:hypothetical protein
MAVIFSSYKIIYKEKPPMRTVVRSGRDVKARRVRVTDLMGLSFPKLEMALKLQLAIQQPELVGRCPVGYRAQVKQNPTLQVSS